MRKVMSKGDQLADALRGAVRATFAASDWDNLTVRRIRGNVELSLGLAPNYFKNDAVWKEKSKSIIEDEVRDCENEAGPVSSQASTGKIDRPGLDARQVGPSRQARATEDGQDGMRKRQKREPSLSGGENEPEFSQIKELETIGFKDGHGSERRRHEAESRGRDVSQSSDKTIERDEDKSGSISESLMSVLEDDEPRPKAKGKGLTNPGPATSQSQIHSKSSTSARKAKSKHGTLDPKAEEIKRLQGWLVKCGVRKMWHRELAGCETAQQKIRHLKDMLTDVGMTGRYSKGRAEEIRQERELQADLAAVQEGDKAWGTTSDGGANTRLDMFKKDTETDEIGSVPKRRRAVAKGLSELAFLDDSDNDDSG